MLLQRERTRHLNTVVHEGKVLTLITDADGDIFYTVKQDGYESNYGQTVISGWENWTQLPFPDENDDPSVVDLQSRTLTTTDGTPILQSRYRTQDATAVAPVQLISGLGHLYVFRQSTEGTLLVDRFVLDGITNKLVRKLDVRFKRSRQKYKPFGRTQDSLDFRDANNTPFFEPTTELSCIRNLRDGWFSVVLAPTTQPNRYRWHIFAYNTEKQAVELVSIRASDEGLFDVRDEVGLDPEKHDGQSFTPGIIQRTLSLHTAEGPARANGAPAATQYDVQEEQQTGNGESQLLRKEIRVMLLVPVETGSTGATSTAALDFKLNEDGTLSQIAEEISGTWDDMLLRSTQREVPLPVNTLDAIRGYEHTTPIPGGRITGLGKDEDSWVEVKTDAAAGSALAYGDLVEITGTRNYNQLYRVLAAPDDDTFVVETAFEFEDLGHWEKVPEEAPVTDGMIMALSRTEDGQLEVACQNHGLAPNDLVQIEETHEMDGTFIVRGREDGMFQIAARWQHGEGVNVAWEAAKRRGLRFDGEGDYIVLSDIELMSESRGLTLSAWISADDPGPGDGTEQVLVAHTQEMVALLFDRDGHLVLQAQLAPKDTPETAEIVRLVSTDPVPADTWVHCAGILDHDAAADTTTLRLLVDGEVAADPLTASGAPTVPVPEDAQEGTGAGGRPRYHAFTVAAAPEGRGFADQIHGFAGKVADLQLWDVARSETEIRNTRFVPLLGREAGLSGYWRMGAIAGEDGQRVVPDFSLSGNDGILYGDAYVSARTLQRTLRDGTTPVVKFENDELFGVTQRATYIEQFEFRPVPKEGQSELPPDEVAALFHFDVWGKRNRRADPEPVESVVESTPVPSEHAAGWYVASCQFTVPDGITLVRSFGLNEIQGEWEALEIRRHRITLISERITEARYSDAPVLAPITGGNGAGQVLAEEPALHGAELVAEWRRRSALLRAVEGLSETERAERIADLEMDAIPHAERAVEEWRAAIDAAGSDPRNAVCRVTNKAFGTGFSLLLNPGHGPDLRFYETLAYPDQLFIFRFQGYDARTGRSVYHMVSKQDDHVLGLKLDQDGQPYAGPVDPDQVEPDNLRVFVEPASDGTHTLTLSADEHVIVAEAGDPWPRVSLAQNADDHARWDLAPQPETEMSNPQLLDELHKRLAEAEAAVKPLLDKLAALEMGEDQVREWYQALAPAGASQDVLRIWQQALASIEAREGTLLAEKSRLDELIDTAEKKTGNGNYVEKLRAEIEELEKLREHLLSEITNAENDPFNYYCRLTNKETGPGWSVYLNIRDGRRLRMSQSESHGDQLLKFEKLGKDPDGATICRVSARFNEKQHLVLWTEFLQMYAGPATATDPSGEYREAGQKQRVVSSEVWVRPTSDGYYTLSLGDHSNAMLGIEPGSGSPPTIQLRWIANSGIEWRIEPVKTVTPRPNEAMFDELESRIEAAQGDLQAKRGELTALEADHDQIKAWRQEREAVIERLNVVQDELRTVNADILAQLAVAQSTALTMAALTGTDAPTHGALLDFISPASRISLGESSLGTVQAAYFDTDGRMRLTEYDAAADALNPSSFKAWLPDGLRACADLRDRGRLVLHQEGDIYRDIPLRTRGAWTLEAWFQTPLPKDVAGFNTLFRGDRADDHHPVLVKADTGALGSYIVQDEGTDLPNGPGFYDSGFSMKRLSSGWHHLAAVTGPVEIEVKVEVPEKPKVPADKDNGGTTVQGAAQPPLKEQTQTKTVEGLIFYIDGRRVGQVPVRPQCDIRVIGNDLNSVQPFGRIAEVRVWEEALAAEEVEAHSKSLLTGNEPGLLAYLPLDEADQNKPKRNDKSGNGYNAQCLDQCQPWTSTAALGHPGSTVASLHEGFIELSTAFTELEHDVTVEAWIKLEDLFERLRPEDRDWRPRILKLGSRFVSNLSWWIDYDNVLKVGVWDRPELDIPINPFVWTHVATVQEGDELRVYVDGVLAASGEGRINLKDPQLLLGHPYDGEDNFSGRIADLRIWHGARSETEIREHMHHRLLGDEPELLHYLPLDTSVPFDRGPHRAAVETGGTPQMVEDTSLPVIPTALVCTEYSTITTEDDRITAMLRRFLAHPDRPGANLITGKRIETLERVWVGNAQYRPTLVGYIEGAPPVPSENLTEDEDYNDATSVDLVQSNSTEFIWNRESEMGFGQTAEVMAGVGIETSFGLGVEETLLDLSYGLSGNISSMATDLRSSAVSTSAETTVTNRLALRGNPEPRVKFGHLGRRFIPKNVGYALVISGVTDVYILRLKRSRRMVAYQVLPNPNIPLDFNTVTFLINPAYTMNGSLDGLTGTAATSDRFHRHVPEMRAQVGSAYPASYYRVREAYALKHAIDMQDKVREAYYTNFNSSDLGDAGLGRPVSTQGGNRKLSDAEQESLKDSVLDAIDSATGRLHARVTYQGWREKIEHFRIRAGKHNVVNSYVWDADGGLRVESQTFASTVEHMIGASATMEGGRGHEFEIEIPAFKFGINSQASFMSTIRSSKSEAHGKALALEVNLDGVEYRGITDYNDYPLMPGEKVDRYRFMSFFLEGDARHFDAFFDEVVDPEWLMSHDEEARLLRMINRNQKNDTWRVLHRVTYVERPALMGFGRETRPLEQEEAPPEIEALETRLARLEAMNTKLLGTLQELANRLD